MMKNCKNCGELKNIRNTFCSEKCYLLFGIKYEGYGLNRDNLYQLYKIDQLTLKEISKYFKCSLSKVHKYVQKYGFDKNSKSKCVNDGDIIGDITVINKITESNTQYLETWKALCRKCNQEFNITAETLDNMKGKSLNDKCCSKCWRFSTRRSKYVTGAMFQSMKNSAKKRNLLFEIDIDFITELFDKQNKKCAITGIELIFGEDVKSHINGKTTASLDRKNSCIGYTKENVWWVHRDINYMKQSYSLEYFKEMCKKVTEHAKSTTIPTEEYII